MEELGIAAKLPKAPVVPRHLRRVSVQLPGGGRLLDCEFVESYRLDGFEGEVGAGFGPGAPRLAAGCCSVLHGGYGMRHVARRALGAACGTGRPRADPTALGCAPTNGEPPLPSCLNPTHPAGPHLQRPTP
jgi:hypothetical protein